MIKYIKDISEANFAQEVIETSKTTPVVSPADYKQIIRNLPNSKIEKKKYAIKALQHITQYDIAIANWFQGNKTEEYPLRYGENPQQKAVALVNENSFEQLGGDVPSPSLLSYNFIFTFMIKLF